MIYGMSLHTKKIIDKDISVFRVPGGWIYNCLGSLTFVPLSNEFAKSAKEYIEELPDFEADYGFSSKKARKPKPPESHYVTEGKRR